jgi:hypothetical protein
LHGIEILDDILEIEFLDLPFSLEHTSRLACQYEISTENCDDDDERYIESQKSCEELRVSLEVSDMTHEYSDKCEYSKYHHKIDPKEDEVDILCHVFIRKYLMSIARRVQIATYYPRISIAFV